MFPALLAILAAATLTPPFGDATARAVDDGGFMRVTVEISINITPAPDYVVVHVLNPEGQETFALGLSGGSTYVGSFSILPFNRAMTFEFGREDSFTLSETVSLLDLGVDPDLLRTTFQPPGQPADAVRWGWLALAAGALAGTALLGWFVWPKPKAAEYALVDTSGDAAVVDETE